MLALRVTGPGASGLSRVPVPACGPADVLVRVHLAGVCGTDLEILGGHMAYFVSGQARYPVTLGHEFVGEVVAAGAAVTALAAGDRVVGECSVGCAACATCARGAYHRCAARSETGIMNRDGGCAEYVLLPARAAHRVPRALPLRAAALVEPTAVALNGVRLGGVGAASRVAVIGDGPIGLLLLQVARAAGAAAVALVGADDARLALGARLGAVAVIDARTCADIPAALCAALGAPPDVLLEASGAAAGVAAAIASAAPGALIVLQGLCGASAAAAAAAGAPPFDLDRVVVNDLTLRGAVGSPGLWPAAIALLESGAVDAAALVTHVLPLADFARALELVRSRAAIKLLLRPGDADGDGQDAST